jgi:hypothetical protein
MQSSHNYFNYCSTLKRLDKDKHSSVFVCNISHVFTAMPSVVILDVVMLDVIMLDVVMLDIIMLDVVMLDVVLLTVAAPHQRIVISTN